MGCEESQEGLWPTVIPSVHPGDVAPCWRGAGESRDVLIEHSLGNAFLPSFLPVPSKKKLCLLYSFNSFLPISSIRSILFVLFLLIVSPRLVCQLQSCHTQAVFTGSGKNGQGVSLFPLFIVQNFGDRPDRENSRQNKLDGSARSFLLLLFPVWSKTVLKEFLPVTTVRVGCPITKCPKHFNYIPDYTIEKMGFLSGKFRNNCFMERKGCCKIKFAMSLNDRGVGGE